MQAEQTPEWHDLTKIPAYSWVKYRAQDMDGEVHDFETEPSCEQEMWFCLDDVSYVETFPVIGDWKQSLISIGELKAKAQTTATVSVPESENTYSALPRTTTKTPMPNVKKPKESENPYYEMMGSALIDDFDCKTIPEPQYDPKNVAFKQKHAHYFKSIGSELVDIYAVLDAFGVTDQAIGHAIKKLLMGGQRGHKDTLKDWQEAIDSIERAIQIKKRKV